MNKTYLEKTLKRKKTLSRKERGDPFFPSLIRLLYGVNKNISFEELDNLTIGKRLKWYIKNSSKLKKYKNLGLIEKVYKFIYLDHLHIREEELETIRPSKNKIIIRSYNWCPYLAACIRLNLDTRTICKEINEHSFQEMLKLIDSRLIFGRNYKKIRPYSDFCEEFIEYKT